MKATILHEYGGPEKLVYEENFPAPQVSGNTVLIRAAASSVNPIDWKIRSGARVKDFPLTLPTILGRDVSGVVEAIGSEVRNFRIGDRVMALTNRAYAELVAVPETDLTHIPDGVDLVEAAAIPLVVLTGDQLVRRATQVQKDQLVLVTGALGGVGRAAVHSAKKIGAQVIAGVRASQVADAQSLRVAGVLAIDDDAAIAAFGPVDAIADTVGGETAAKLMAHIKPGGRIGFASVLPEGTAEKFPSITVTRVFAGPDPSKVREFADDIRDGKFVLPIGARMALKDAGDAQELAQKGGIGKILLISNFEK
jgi:NADPH:quinone reductase-like Zn-dependent oxidoreductase